MDFQQQLDAMNKRIQDWIAQAQAYFQQLDDYEKYAWGGEALGFVFFIVGIVLLF